MAYKQHSIGQRGNTLDYNTAHILRQLKADGGAPDPHAKKKRGHRNEKLRLAALYGSGVSNVKNVKGRLKPLMKGDESDYETKAATHEIDYVHMVEVRLSNSPLFTKNGVIKLEQMWSGSRMTIQDLIKQFHINWDVALTRNEAASLVKTWDLVVTEKKRTLVNFNALIVRLYALSESMRKKVRDIRKDEEEQLKKRKEDRLLARPNVPGEESFDSDELRRRVGLIQLHNVLHKLNVVVPRMYQLVPQHFMEMVNHEVHGSLSLTLLKDFCHFNLNLKVTEEEAAALLFKMDYTGHGKVSLATWLYELKKLGLGMSGQLDPLQLDFAVEEEDARGVVDPGQYTGGGVAPQLSYMCDWGEEDEDEMETGEQDGDNYARGFQHRNRQERKKHHQHQKQQQQLAVVPVPQHLVPSPGRKKDELPLEAKLSHHMSSPSPSVRAAAAAAAAAAAGGGDGVLSPISVGGGGGGSPMSHDSDEMSLVSNMVKEKGLRDKEKYNFHSSGISIPPLSETEAVRVLSKKQQHNPDFERPRKRVVRVPAGAVPGAYVR